MAVTPPLYVVHLESSTARRARLQRRLEHHGLTSSTTWVPAHAIDPNGKWTPEWIAEASRAAFASHLAAIRLFLADTPESSGWGILLEDDAMLHDEFVDRLEGVIENLPRGTPLCVLGYLVSEWGQGLEWAGRDPGCRNVVSLVQASIWGAHAYMISREYARVLVERFGELALEELPWVTETITHDSGGLVAYPSLAIQDAIDTSVRPPDFGWMWFHTEGQAAWRYGDYAAAETEHLSPLAAERDPRRTIGLAMIVRDEQEHLPRCIASVRGLIDSWTIVDTGSTDETPELVRTLLGDIPGNLHHRPWRDFGTNRNELLELAQGSAEYLLLVDADETLVERGPIPPLGADEFLVSYEGPVEYWLPRVIRADRGFRYVGAIHEYLTADGEHSSERLYGLRIRHHGGGGGKGRRLEADRVVLETELERRPDDVRTVFYLAQTFRDLGDHERARELYLRRSKMGGWPEEAFYAAFQAGLLFAADDLDTALAQLEEAHRFRPTRAEPLHFAARLCRTAGRQNDAYRYATRACTIPRPADVLFVHRDTYAWGAEFERSIAAYWVGELDEAVAANDALLDGRGLPADVVEAVHRNRALCLEALADRTAGRRQRGEVAMLGDLVPDTRFAELRLEVEPDWPLCDPVLSVAPEGLTAIVKSSNFSSDVTPSIERGETGEAAIFYSARLTRSLELVSVEPVRSSPFLGDPPKIRLGDRVLSVEREAEPIGPSGAEIFRHQFATRSSDGLEEASSGWFRLTGYAEERITGLEILGEDLILGFGVENRIAALAVCPVSAILDLLRR